MEWLLAVLNDPLVLQGIIGLTVTVAGYLFRQLGVTIDPEIVKGVCEEVIELLRREASELRGEDGKISLIHSERLLNKAIGEVRYSLKNKKPRWLPRFIWNWGLNKISAHLIKTMIEGALKVYKQRTR